MRVLGIDPSSSCTGLALIEDGELIATTNWKPTKGKSAVWNLTDFFEWMFENTKPPLNINGAKKYQSHYWADMACIEFLSVSRNATTTRVISHYQAVAALACKLNKMTVIEARVSSARKEALGKGNLSKDECYDAIRKRFPDHEFARKTTGGTDETDAAVLALAGPGIAER